MLAFGCSIIESPIYMFIRWRWMDISITVQIVSLVCSDCRISCSTYTSSNTKLLPNHISNTKA